MAQFGQQAASRIGSRLVGHETAVEWFDDVPGERMRIRVDSRTVAGAYTIVESVAQAMAGPPLHRHREDEVFHILEGCLTFQRGTERLDAPAGSIVVIPGGMAHGWFNFGSEPARMVVTFTPGGLEEVRLGLGRVAPLDLPAYAARHDIHVLGPPLGTSGAAA